MNIKFSQYIIILLFFRHRHCLLRALQRWKPERINKETKVMLALILYTYTYILIINLHIQQKNETYETIVIVVKTAYRI